MGAVLAGRERHAHIPPQPSPRRSSRPPRLNTHSSTPGGRLRAALLGVAMSWALTLAQARLGSPTPLTAARRCLGSTASLAAPRVGARMSRRRLDVQANELNKW